MRQKGDGSTATRSRSDTITLRLIAAESVAAFRPVGSGAGSVEWHLSLETPVAGPRIADGRTH